MSSQKPRVMVVSAHAADFCSRSGGTILNYVQFGSEVRVLDLTYGERGESNSLWQTKQGISLDDVKAIRETEAKQAAAILGADIHFMDFGDNPLIVDEGRYRLLVDEIRAFQPKLLLTHWLNDPLNPDHAVTSAAMIQACVEATDPGIRPASPIAPFPEIFLFEPSVPSNDLSNFRPDTYIDVTQVFETKLLALSELKTQSGLPKLYTQWGEFRARQAVMRHDLHGSLGKRDVRYAEAFQRYTPYTGLLLPLSLEGC